MWTVIYIAPSAKIAEKIQDRLTKEGFLVKVRASQHGKQYEVLVPESELDDVREALSYILQS
ncbi:ribosomal protein S8 [Caldalkalibacillus uzonensis]|uniref:Ribosomal protein S8 n=1 Tax=Caldalkalibacillus uzonensis TaxID=353224 RepID=A0ABU0CQT1_9BACI|nr:glutamate decarboxylase [Caldalkalibacillus uzonensis]MDQ0337860.1 ribosomal protein S8 [Caldalkalibacillus uzonensis]